jgi:hypothetical protein
VKYVDDFVLLPKEEVVLKGMTERLIEKGRCCGMEVITTVALFHSWVIPCEICGRQSGTETSFLPSTLVALCQVFH